MGPVLRSTIAHATNSNSADWKHCPDFSNQDSLHTDLVMSHSIRDHEFKTHEVLGMAYLLFLLFLFLKNFFNIMKKLEI